MNPGKMLWSVSLVVLALASAAGKETKLKPEELVARHLESIGTPEARAAVKSRVVDGVVRMTMMVGGSGSLDGQGGLVSEGRKLRFTMHFGHTSYNEERLVYNGEKIEVAQVIPGQRSDLGNFILAQDQVYAEGLIGGTLSSAWPLLDLEARKAKLKYNGLKKIGDRELHELHFSTSRRGGDVEILLYFEPETFRHVRSVYSIVRRAQIVGGGQQTTASRGSTESSVPTPGSESGEVATARQQEQRVRLEENFSEFRRVDGLVLPMRWSLRLSAETTRTRVWDWDITLQQIRHNVPVDVKQFAVP